MSVIGLDLGGTKLAAALFEKDGKIVRKDTKALPRSGGPEVGILIKNTLNEILAESSRSSESVDAVGICVPGISYSKTGRVWAPNIPGWEDYPLLEELESVLGDSNIKVKIDSDRACYILGETWLGSAKGCKDAVFLAVGTGIGAGILVNGEILRGSNDIGGAIGWLALDRPFMQKYVSCGCFEYHASGEGIAKVAKELLRQDGSYTGVLRNKSIETITAYEIFEAYDLNDPIAAAVLNQAVEFWGMTVANLVSLFNPEKIIFGGGVFGPAARFLERIMSEAKKWAQPISINQVKLEQSALGGDAGLIGAGYLALKSISR